MTITRPQRIYNPNLLNDDIGDGQMKIVNSLKSMKTRHKDCRIIRRRGRSYIINKTNPRFKARQG